jgi:electron-transferring-flavoprotein dehydrogenase
VEESNIIDVLFVGAGPASLAGAIKLKQLLNRNGKEATVVVIEKAESLGQHNLSGAVFEAGAMDELIPDWKQKKDAFVIKTLGNRVENDEIVFLAGDKSWFTLPELIVPSYLRHKGDYTLSVSEMVKWLGNIAEGIGVEIYTSFVASELVIENNVVKGIKLSDKGLNKEGKKQSNYIPGEILAARVTVLGEGSLGLLSEEIVNKLGLSDGMNSQIHSVGIKEIIKLPENNCFGTNRVVHTMGFPNKVFTPDIFGGGTIYSMGANTVAVSLLLALDWRYCDLNPQQELQVFKSHRYIKKLIEGGEVIAYGAKTIPEGGFYSLPGLTGDGFIIIGDAAGLTSVRKLKGLHYAIKSGMLAAEAIAKAIEEHDFSKRTLQTYEGLLEKSFVMKDIYAARNYRQVFEKAGRAGLYLGAPLSLIQQCLPWRLKTEPDYKAMRKVRLNRQYKGGIERQNAVSLSGTHHREDEPSHITFSDPAKCTRCNKEFGCHPCEFFCPAEVYKFREDNLILSPSNCIHCQTCRVKCPHQVIKWQIPEGGDGPRYKTM